MEMQSFIPMGQIWGKSYYIMLHNHLWKPFILRAFRNIVTFVNTQKVPPSADKKTAKTLGKSRGLAVFSFFETVRIKLYDNAIVQQRGESSN